MEERLDRILNWLKLTLLLDYVTQELRKLLLEKWKMIRGYEWDSSPESITFLKETMGKKHYKNASRPVRNKIDKGDIENWDVTAVSYVLRSLNIEWVSVEEKERMEAAVKIRNHLAHHPSKVIPQEEFCDKWQTLTGLLSFLNVPTARIDEIVEKVKFRTSDPSSVFSPRVMNPEANKLKDEGNTAFRNADYAQAIEKFDNALNVASLKEAERAVLFSNRSSAFLQMAKAKQDQERKHFAKRAENDAKKAAHLQPMWYKAHFRLGDAYKLLEKYEKAITAYDEALSLDPSLEIVLTRRDECRQELGKRQRQDHMDTMNMHPLSTEAIIKQINQNQKKKILTKESYEELMDLLKKGGHPLADLTEGIRYRDGRDTAINYELAAKHFSRAASKGNAQGIYELAHLTQKGLGVKKDYRLALQLYKQAAAMPPFLPSGVANEGVLPAIHSIALMYDEGVGVEMSPVTAFEWYKRAADLGYGPSANNLAWMYDTGKGVPEQDSEKAVQYWKLAAQGKITRAMHSLAEHYLKTGDAGQARNWFKFAVEGGEIEAMSSQQEFEAACRAIEEKQKLSFPFVEKWEKENNLSSSNLSGKSRLERFAYGNNPDMQKCMEQIVHICRRSMAVSPSNRRNVYKYDYKVISEYASQGRVYAQQVLRAMDHFASALFGLVGYEESPDVSMGDFIIAEAAHCFETAGYVFAFPEEHRILLKSLVKKKLANLKGQTCEMDCYARQCYAFLQINSYAENVRFLEKCIGRYPKVPYFYDVLASMHGFLETYDEGIKAAQKGLDLFPKDYELMYSKAALTKLAFDGRQDRQNVIHCYESFLQHAPSDHRKVPESYYSMAAITLLPSLRNHDAPIDEAVRKYYEKGLESEKQLLPCFLPYEDNSSTKGLVDSFLEIKNLSINLKNQGIKNFSKCSKKKLNVSGKSGHTFKESPMRKMPKLTDPVRVQTILDHRKLICSTQGFNSAFALHRSTVTPRYAQCAPTTLAGLKAVTLSEMNPTVDKVYEGHVIDVLIIDDPGAPLYSLVAVLEDSVGDVMRGFFYNVEGDQRIKYGAKISIVHPYMRIGANDQKPGIRVDDPKTLFFHQEDPSVRRCRYCGEKNAKFSCTRCKTADYCSKECQTNDWKILKHKFICNL